MISKILKSIFAVLIVTSLLGAEVNAKLIPEETLWWSHGLAVQIDFDGPNQQWVVHPRVYEDSWMRMMPYDDYKALVEKMARPFPVKGKHQYKVIFKKFESRQPERFVADLLALGAVGKRRLVLVNPDDNIGISPTTKIHPHLGLMVVGTVAQQEGWDVILHDELIQGHINLEEIIEPGDILGLSLVVTGIERGVKLAERAKQLGVRCVIAGNDAAIFRDNQLLSLPNRPIHAVFTSNSTNSVREFFRQCVGDNFGGLRVPDMKTMPGRVQRSNQSNQLATELKSRNQLRRNGGLISDDGFVVPNFNLFPQSYWEQIWKDFRLAYGHKHQDQKLLKNAVGLLAQGCTRTRGSQACSYCSIAGVGDVSVPSRSYLEHTLAAYNEFGITEFFNVTDSAFEMAGLVTSLEDISPTPFTALTIYARAQGIAHSQNQRLLERWLRLTESSLQLNIGVDSGNELMLRDGINKSSLGSGSRLRENMDAILAVVCAGVHIHCSVVFGSPGETLDTCEETMDLVRWIRSVSKHGELNLVESDAYWLNFGSPSAQVFTDYAYAKGLAARAGKSISREQWVRHFWNQRNALVVPMTTEKAWYEFFTHISFEQAEDYNAQINTLMAQHAGAITGRAFYPRKDRQEEA